MRTEPAAVFWDMDGTLVDSEPMWGMATYELSERLGRRLTPELRARTVGGSLVNTLSICAEHAGLTLADLDIEAERRRIYDRVGELIADITPNPGVRELLDDLGPTPMLVTTNTERELADRSIDGVGRHYFVDSITGDEVSTPKPDPEMYLEAARRVDADPGDCVVFEDSWNGMSAATAAGCVVFGLSPIVPDGATSLNDLHGTLSLAAVTADHVNTWFDRLR